MKRSVIGVLLAAGLLGLTASPVGAAKAKAPAAALGPEERRALAVVEQWVAALVAKDADRAAAYLDPAVQYRDDPHQVDPKKGRDAALADMRVLLRGLTAMRIEQAYAVGSARDDVLVLARRVDEFTLPGGRKVTMPMGAYFRVRDGRILEWFDTPLAEMPPPPAGAPPAQH